MAMMVDRKLAVKVVKALALHSLERDQSCPGGSERIAEKREI